MNKYQKGFVLMASLIVLIVGIFLLDKYQKGESNEFQEGDNQNIVEKIDYNRLVNEENKELVFSGNDGKYLKFSGRTLISGTYFRAKMLDIADRRKIKEMTCIELDEFSYAKIPHINDIKTIETFEDFFDSSRLICFNDSDLSKELANLNDSGKADLLIDNYEIYQDGFSGIQSADLVEISKIKNKYVFSDMSSWETYEDNEYNYSFKILPNFYLEKFSNGASIIERASTWNSFLCHCGEGGTSLSLDVLENKENIGLRDWLNYFIEKDCGNETIKSGIKEIKINNKNGLMIDFGERGGGSLIVVEDNGLIYRIRGYDSFYPQSEDYSYFIYNFELK